MNCSRVSLCHVAVRTLAVWCAASGILFESARAQSPISNWLNGGSPPPHREGPSLDDDRRPDDREGGEARDKDKDDSKEPEQPPGLLGYHFHGRGGLKAEYIYTGEVFTNMRGGLSTNEATQYRGLFDLALTADLEKMGFFTGGKFFLLAENGHGRGLTQDYVGDYQWLSSIDGRDFTQVSEYWWERSFFDDGFLTIRLGKQDCNKDFAVVDLAGDFVHSSYGSIPNIPMPSWPETSMAAVAIVRLHEGCFLKAGVWDGVPYGGNWGFSGTGTTFSIGEFKAEYKLDDRLPGDFHVGMWYHSDRFDDITPAVSLGCLNDFRARKPCSNYVAGGPLGAVGDVYSGNYGVYGGIEQLIYAEPETPADHKGRKDDKDKDEKEGDKKDSDDKDEPEKPERPQGLGIFFQYGWAPGDRNPANYCFGSGVVYKGLLPRRDDDIIGAGVEHVIFSESLPNQSMETAIEFFYKAQLSPWTVLQPDLQYIARPDGQYRDAFVFGVRFELTL